MNLQRGFSLAIGSAPLWLFYDRYVPICKLLVKWAKSTEPINLVEKRCNAIRSLERLYTRASPKAGLAFADSGAEEILRLVRTDYSVDSRGDVGSMIRIAGMNACLSYAHYFSDPAFRDALVKACFCQRLERLDRVKKAAQAALDSLNVTALIPYTDPEILRSIVYAAGAPQPNNPAINLIITQNLLPNILETRLNFLSDEPRIESSLLHLLHVCLSEHHMELVLPDDLVHVLIEKYAKDCRKNMNTLIRVFEILNCLRCKIGVVDEFLREQEESHPFPRIRSIIK